MHIKPVLGSPVSIDVISWRSRCVIRTALLYIVGSIVLCPLLTMDNLIVCQLLGILCIVALILVFIIQGFSGVCIRVTLGCQSGCIRVCPCINVLLFFPAVRAVLLRSMSCRVMVKNRVIPAVGIQVQAVCHLPIISQAVRDCFLCGNGLSEGAVAVMVPDASITACTRSSLFPRSP